MRILFERNIALKYRQPLASESWTTTASCENHFQPTAPDKDIAAFARQNNWVVMTTDDDFFAYGPPPGILLLKQDDNPSPGDVVDAVDRIGANYPHEYIGESVPGNWVP